MRSRALSLLETMVALGVLLTGLVGILSLFQAGLRMSRSSESQLELSLQARRLMTERLQELRELAKFRALAEGTTPWVVEGPLRSRWVVSRQELYSSDSSLEQAFAEDNRKLLSRSAYRLELQAEQGGARVVWLAACPEPLRGWSTTTPLSITLSGANPLPKDQTLELTVHCQAQDGYELDDLVVSWVVVPVDGVGMLESVSRDGKKARFRNRTRHKNGTPRYTPGVCRVMAQASYAGETRQVQSAPIVLLPP
ncbi:MAG: hypothetical protein KF760_08135 [Candidatus Eremiobacteraeota bacterium]|nr:hypothetical protein [Candidatus Eremiobacteraeota bacterium]MCW5867963.1 hypothetical protein [Candidatus Eremiobacteraeota bacterium]